VIGCFFFCLQALVTITPYSDSRIFYVHVKLENFVIKYTLLVCITIMPSAVFVPLL
jgi:hypothetical protein